MREIDVDLIRAIIALSELYTPDEIKIWLEYKNDLLDGRTALSVIQNGGADNVLAVIERLTSGAYI